MKTLSRSAKGMVLCLAALSGCVSTRADSQAASTSSPTAAQAPTTSASGGDSGGSTSSVPATSQGAPPFPRTEAGTTTGHTAPRLSPPAGIGELRTNISGCAATATEQEAQAFVSTTRGLPPPPTIQAVQGGALITHPLDHTCCLKLAVTSRIEGERSAVVRETLSGAPCRCRCSSTVKTALGLKPGLWTITIELEDTQGVRRVHEQNLEVGP